MRSHHGTWVLPKGRAEPGETPEQTARREIEEEIGLAGLELGGYLGWTEHQFERDGVLHRKRVEWFLFGAPADSPLSAQPRHGSLDCGWFSSRQALDLLTHSDQRRILRRGLALTRKLSKCPRSS